MFVIVFKKLVDPFKPLDQIKNYVLAVETLVAMVIIQITSL